MDVKSLADEKLLDMKDEILEKVRGLKKNDDSVAAGLSELLINIAVYMEGRKIQFIISSLDFETRHHRESDIVDTEKHTFEWVLQDYHNSAQQEIGFRKWLQFGNDVYWVSGKVRFCEYT